MSQLTDNLKQLQEATDQYIEAETQRLNDEVTILQGILDGRTAGRGLQKISTTAIAAIAYNDLAAFLAS